MAAPTLTGFTPAITFAENLVNVAPQLLDNDVTFMDPDGDFDGGFLTMSGLLAEDSISLRDEGTGAGQIGLIGTTVTFGGVTIGTLAGGVGATLTITFNAAATSTAIDALIQNLTYANSSDTPTASRDLLLNVVDAAGNGFLDVAPGTPIFVPLTGAANPLNGVDMGQSSTPIFVDLDGDGDLDIVSGEFYGTLRAYDNNDADTGFTQLTGAANPFNSIDVGYLSAPTFADLDGDGDLDMVVGENSGTLQVYDNNDADAGFTQLTGGANPFTGIDVGKGSTPTFVDLDGDGDLDMVVGEYDGYLNVYDSNDGDAGFTQLTGPGNPFDGIDVGRRSTPTFVDLDGDGDLDMVTGDLFGTLQVYDSNDANAGFTQLTGAANPFDGIDVGTRSAPTFVDLDGDGDLDMVVGQLDGTLTTIENTTPRGKAIAVTVTAENDAPTLTDFAANITFAENTVNADPQVLDATVMFGDAEGNFDAGSLTVTGLLTADIVSLRNEGAGGGQIGLSGADVTFGGLIIGTMAGGAGAALMITFNAAATSASIDALIQNLTFANSSDTPTATRDLVLSVADSDATTTQGTITVGVTAENDLTTITGLRTDVAVIEDIASDVDLSGVTLGDPDNDTGFTLTLSTDSGTLSGVSSGTVTVTGAGTTALTLTGLASDIDAYLNVSSAIQYTGAQDLVGNGVAVITLTANDGSGVETLGPVNVDITNVNDAPTLTGLPTSIAADEAVASDVNLSGITLVDVEDDLILLTITATSGLLSATSSAGVLVLSSDTVTLQLYGTALALNTFLQDASAVQFTGTQDLFGTAAATLTVSLTDLLGGQIVQGAVQVDIADVVETQTGDTGNNTLTGGIGVDVLNGLDGNDKLYGGESNDVLNGDGGTDQLFGGDGADTLYGGSGGDTLNGNDGNDVMWGGVGADVLSGGNGDDTLEGEEGLDVLIGGAGNDAVRGGGGNDTMTGNDGLDDMHGDGGNDEMNGGNKNDVMFGGTQGDTMEGGDGSDTMWGDNGNDTMNGNKGNDEMHGGVGLDVMSGSVGLDNMFGGNGHDTMSGGNGHDTLTGGNGHDILTGGVGSDVFVFANSSDDDTITDFEVGSDTIQLIGLVAGDVSFSNAGGGDTLMTLSTGDTVLIENTTIAQLNTFSDFDFV